ncbi:MAG: MBL fold metallo-hydrolase [Gammaproteobacteria bacterium]|jgi:cyclase|nr:MBL fold metallo-hydrolase [Gammaproteobacteria bacterium]
MKAWTQTSLLLLLAISTLCSGQQDFSNVTVQSQQLGESVYMLTGAGGNIGVSAGADGVFIIDDQYAPLSDKILTAIRAFSKAPIRYVINTHWHGDHTGGNETFAATGSVIIAHNNVRKRMSSDQFMAHFQRNAEASPPQALPVITFSDRLSLHLNGESVSAYHQPHAHTDGDSIIHWPSSNVLHMGDTFFNTTYPFIDLSSGGSLPGMIKATANGLALANDDTKIIPGHGPLASKSDLQAYHDMLIQVRDLVAAAKDSGQTLEQAIAAEITAELDQQWGQGFIKPADIITFAWQSPD